MRARPRRCWGDRSAATSSPPARSTGTGVEDGALTERLRSDVEALAAIERRSASAGERASAEWVAERLREAGAEDVRLEPFSYQQSFGWAHAAHFAMGAIAALGGRRALAAATLLSFELEYSGRRQPLRRVLPAGEGTNVVGRLPARGEVRRSLVVVAHHDAAKTGLMWDPRLAAAGNRRAERTGRRASLALLPELALAGAAIGVRLPSAVVLGAAAALSVEVANGATVPGANDNASGVAALLTVVEQLASERPEGLEVVALAPGCEESGMGGMAAFLRGPGAALDPARTLVLGFDTVGSGTPVVVTAEGGLWPVRYREADVQRAELGAARAGLSLRRWRLGAWTDPALACLAGLPAISLLSVRDGGFPNYHLPSDTPEHVDFDCVQRCVQAGVAMARDW